MAPHSRKRVVFCCEACGAALVKRTSYLNHKFLRHDAYVCDNPVCGATYIGISELTHLSSPSGIPEALASELPPTPAMLRAEMVRAWRAQAANDQGDLFQDGQQRSEEEE